MEGADRRDRTQILLYGQQEKYVFMDNESFDQYELTKDQLDDAWKYLKDGMVCSMVLYNGNPVDDSTNHDAARGPYTRAGCSRQHSH